MKQFVIASVISIAILLLLPCSTTTYADENTGFNVWMVFNDEGYDSQYPHWCGRSSLVITNKPAGLKVALVYLKNTDTNLYGFTYFCYSTSAADFNFSCVSCGNHQRSGSKYTSIEDAKSLYSREYQSAYTVSNPLHTITGSDGLDYYVWYPSTVYESGVNKKRYDYFEYDGFNAVYYFEGTDFTMSSVIASVMNGPEVEIDGNGNLISKEPLKCPSDVLMAYFNYMGSDYGDVEGVAPRLYFYPEDILGKKIVVEFTYKYNTYIRRKMTIMEQIKHPTYALSSKECPKCELEFTRRIEIEIPSTIEEIPEFSSFDTVLSIPSLFYDAEKNKIIIQDYPKYKEIKEEIHNCISNYSFNIGSPVCVDCEPFSGNPYKNKYKHIGKAISVSADCQLFQGNLSSNVFNVNLEINSSGSDISSYTNPDNVTTTTKDEDKAMIFVGTDSTGEKNDYGNTFSDSEWDNLLYGNDSTYVDNDMSFKDSVSWLKNLTTSLKEFPDFFAEFFNFLPLSQVIGITIMSSLIVGLVVGFLKLILS